MKKKKLRRDEDCEQQEWDQRPPDQRSDFQHLAYSVEEQMPGHCVEPLQHVAHAEAQQALPSPGSLRKLDHIALLNIAQRCHVPLECEWNDESAVRQTLFLHCARSAEPVVAARASASKRRISAGDCMSEQQEASAARTDTCTSTRSAASIMDEMEEMVRDQELRVHRLLAPPVAQPQPRAMGEMDELTKEKELAQCTAQLAAVQLAGDSAGQPITEGARVVLIGGRSALRGQQGSVAELIDAGMCIGFDAGLDCPKYARVVFDSGSSTRIVPVADLRSIVDQGKQNTIVNQPSHPMAKEPEHDAEMVPCKVEWGELKVTVQVSRLEKDKPWGLILDEHTMRVLGIVAGSVTAGWGLEQYIGWQLLTIDGLPVRDLTKVQQQLDRCDRSARGGAFGSARLCFREPLQRERQKAEHRQREDVQPTQERLQDTKAAETPATEWRDGHAVTFVT